MRHQSSNFGGEGSSPESLWKGLKVESILKFKWFFIAHGLICRSN